MHFFDMRTVVFVGVLTDILCTLVVFALWQQNRRRFDGMAFWMGDYFLQTTGLLLICLRGAIPDWMSIVLANALVVSGAILGYQGLALFVGKNVSQRLNGLVLVAFVGLHGYLTYSDASVAARSLNVAAALLVIMLQCFWLLLRGTEMSMRPQTRWIGFVFGGYCLTFFIRIIWLCAQPDPASDYFRSGSAEVIFHTTLQMLLVLLTYGYGLMVNQRLLMAIRSQEEKYSKTFHSSPYAILLTRLADGKILEVNHGFVKIVGYSCSETLGKTTLELGLWAHAEDRAAVVAQLTETNEISGVEFQFKRSSGEVITALFSAVILTINNERCLLTSLDDITERKQAELEREKLVTEREKALSQVKTLRGLLPICASCKKIRDDKGYWNQIESYVRMHSDAEFSHGICPECMKLHYPEFEGKGA